MEPECLAYIGNWGEIGLSQNRKRKVKSVYIKGSTAESLTVAVASNFTAALEKVSPLRD